jgi:hypothetical protein
MDMDIRFWQKRISRSSTKKWTISSRTIIFKNNRLKLPNILKKNNRKSKKKRYIVLPYNNHRVDAYAERLRLTNLVNETFNQVELKVASKYT